MNKESIKKSIEKKFLGIRGWKNWEEYDKIQESTELDKNIRWELIDIAIQETLNTSTAQSDINLNKTQDLYVKSTAQNG